jgi:hypothetical protein
MRTRGYVQRAAKVRLNEANGCKLCVAVVGVENLAGRNGHIATR